jgi:hypothetical protein
MVVAIAHPDRRSVACIRSGAALGPEDPTRTARRRSSARLTALRFGECMSLRSVLEEPLDRLASPAEVRLHFSAHCAVNSPLTKLSSLLVKK